MQCRRKAVYFEAIQFRVDNILEVFVFSGAFHAAIDRADDGSFNLTLQTPSGKDRNERVHVVSPGDYIVKSPEGDVFVYAGKAFNDLFEIVERWNDWIRVKNEERF